MNERNVHARDEPEKTGSVQRAGEPGTAASPLFRAEEEGRAGERSEAARRGIFEILNIFEKTEIKIQLLTTFFSF